MTPPLGVPFVGYAAELARTRLDALPFADYADPDPDRLPLDEDAEDADACGGCGADAGERCREWCIGSAAHRERSAW